MLQYLKLKGLEEQLVAIRSDMTEKNKEIEELTSRLHVQTANVAELRAEVKSCFLVFLTLKGLHFLTLAGLLKVCLVFLLICLNFHSD